VTIGYFVLCVIVDWTQMAQGDHDILYMMLGQLTAAFIMIISYYFGFSKQSK